jgi:hypothetical protein
MGDESTATANHKENRMVFTDYRQTAYHEAGHAVADTILGRIVLTATVRPDTDDLLGFVQCEPPAEEDVYSPSIEYVRSMVASLLAGSRAERRYLNSIGHSEKFDGDQSQSDYERAADWAMQFMDYQRILDDGAVAAEALLVEHWQAVRRVARALYNYGTLSGERVRAIVASPHIEEMYESGPKRQLAAVCRERGAAGPFSISTREAAELTGIEHSDAHAILRTFVGFGLLEVVEKSKGRKPCVFRYTGDFRDDYEIVKMRGETDYRSKFRVVG